MDSPRSAKRRKLNEINGVSGKDVAPSPGSTSAKATLELLKARSNAEKQSKLAMRKGRKAVDIDKDIYDDIEGAHTVSGTTSARTKRFHGGNQRNDHVDNATRTPPRAGFFKRFAREDAEQNGEDATSSDSEELSDDSKAVDSVKQGEVNEVERNTPVRVSARSRRPTAKAAETLSSARRTTGQRKMFEDKIKDVEVAASKDAAQSPNTPASAQQKRRRKNATVDSPNFNTSDKTQPKPQQPKNSASCIKHRKEIVPSSEIMAKQELEVVDGQIEIEDSEGDGAGSAGIRLADTPLPKRKLVVSALPAVPVVKVVSDEPLFRIEELQAVRNIFVERMTGARPLILMHLEDEYDKVATMLSQTIAAGESNSMLLIGARGSGKTALVNQVLRENTIEHSNDFLVVRLNGFIHTDDKIALRDIWRQLGREMDSDETESTTRNYADTLTSLLALLSHSAEMGEEAQPRRISKSVIFILDEFDLFAHHPRQTLLYNLFDIAQSRKAPIAVLGLTTRVDVAESLEKRVKSRFSHRYVHLSLSKSYSAFSSACRSALTLYEGDFLLEGDPHGCQVSSEENRWSKPKPPVTTDIIEKWNQHVLVPLGALEAYENHLHRIYYTSKSIPEYLSSMLPPLATLSCTQSLTPSKVVSHIVSTLSLAPVHPDSKLNILPSLSTLQLALLICACRLNAIHGTETITFALVYEEYRSIASKAKVQATASGSSASARISTKAVARLAWSELLEMGLVMETDGRRGEGTGRVDVALEEIGAAGMDLGIWGRWCKQI